MRNKGLKIVVTGGAGFIGSWVVDYLLKEMGSKIDKIVVMDIFTRGTMGNLRNSIKGNKVEVAKVDVRDIENVGKVAKGADYIVHEAVIRITQCAEDPRLCNEILVNGTFNIMEACVKYNVKKLVFNSSASVYGQPLKLPMKEDDLYNNDTMYGAAKIANEQTAKAFRKMYGMNYVCLRPFNAYGPRMDIHGVYTEVLIRWLDAIDKGEQPIIYGNGINTLDFIYVEDIARATILAINSKVNEGFFNVGSGKQVSLNKLLNTVLKLTKSPLKPLYKKQEEKTNYATKREASIVKARDELGFVAETSLEKGLARLIEWRKKEKGKRK